MLEPDDVYRQWYARAIRGGGSEWYATQVGLSAVLSAFPSLNPTEGLTLSVYCDAREGGRSQFDAFHRAAELVAANEPLIREWSK
ncbi:MAG: hypothetical protein OXE87_11865 [Chloroflexi bacterium]|nr:hypothetical protein [Chloroflexota bacterium]